jgi:hypothetical protein
MSFPIFSTLQTPILQELNAVGGSEDVRFLYERLTAYFPQINENDLQKIEKWRKLVQKAGKELDEIGLLTRTQGIWKITERGKQRIESETIQFSLQSAEIKELNHREIQEMLGEIGKSLNYFTELEFEFYDVVWREKENSPRISHVFEVQSKGNIDSAFAKLKRAYDAQRTIPFLVVASERDTNRANQSLQREFVELQQVITILSFAEVNKIHQNLNSISQILPKFLAK